MTWGQSEGVPGVGPNPHLSPWPLFHSDSRIVFTSRRLGRFHSLQSRRAAVFDYLSKRDTKPKEYFGYKAISSATHQKLWIYIHRGLRLSLATLATAMSRRTLPSQEGQWWGTQGLWQVPSGQPQDIWLLPGGLPELPQPPCFGKLCWKSAGVASLLVAPASQEEVFGMVHLSHFIRRSCKLGAILTSRRLYIPRVNCVP